MPRFAQRGIQSGQGPGRHGWVAERTHAQFTRSRRLPIGYERRADIYQAFSNLAASLTTLNQIRQFCNAHSTLLRQTLASYDL